MKIDMNVALTVFGGDELKTGEGKPLLLGEACKNALARVAEGARPDGSEMIRRYSLGCSIADSMRGKHGITLSAKDNGWLQELLAAAYKDAPIVAGQAIMLLDPPEVQADEPKTE